MKKSAIEVGKTYYNRGKGRTRRTVLDIGKHIEPPPWNGFYGRPDEPVVLFDQSGRIDRLYLSSFAQWAGGVVEEP